MCFSNDGSRLVTGGWDSNVILWDVATGREIRTFLGHTFKVRSLDISKDGEILITGGEDNSVRLWDISTGELIRTEEYSSWVIEVDFNPDKQQYAILTEYNRILMKNADSGREIWSWEPTEYVAYSLCFHPDGDLLAIGCDDGHVRFFEQKTGKLVQVFKAHNDVIEDICFDHEGIKLVTTSWDSTVKIWDVESNKLDQKLTGHQDRIRWTDISSNGKHLASVTRQMKVLLWNIQTGDIIKSFSDQSFASVCFSPGGEYLALGSTHHSAELWNVTTKRKLRSFRGFSRRVQSVDFSTDGRYLFSSSGGVVSVWDLSWARQIRTYVIDSTRNVTSLQLSPDNKRLTVGIRRRVELLEPSTGDTICVFNGHGRNVRTVDWSSDGRFLVSASSDNTARIWDAETGEELLVLKGHTDRVDQACFSPKNEWVATSSWDKTVKLWDTASGQLVKTYSGNEPVGFSPDGQYLIFHKGDALSQVQLSLNKENGQFRTSQKFDWQVMDISPDNRYLAAAGEGDQGLIMWDLRSRKKLFSFSNHNNMISAIDFSPAGKIMATGSWDNTIKLINTRTGEEIVTLITVNKDEYVIITPDHYYTASPDALKAVHFRKGNQIFPFEQFDLRLNRPDIVAARIGKTPQKLITGYKQAYQKRLNKMGFTAAQVKGDMHLPKIKITSEKLPVVTDSKEINFAVQAWDQRYYLDRLNVYVNDVPIYGIKGISLKDDNRKKVDKKFTVELSNGINKIQVSCHNEKGIESIKESIEVIYQGKGQKPDLYIISVGISQYQKTAFNLNYAAKDAQDMVDLFQQGFGHQFDQVHVLLLTDADATYNRLSQVKSFVKDSQVDDTFLLFVAGHGLLDSEFNYYFACHDVDFDRPKKNGFPYENFVNLLDGIPPRKKLFLMDACHSGEIDKNSLQFTEIEKSSQNISSAPVRGFQVVEKKESNRLSFGQTTQLLQTLFADLRRGTGATIISSSTGSQYAFESTQWRNGIFTYAFLKGIQENSADINHDRQINISEIRDFVIRTVTELTGGKQTPTSRRINLKDDFRIW